MSDTISAGELRLAGLAIPESIPDCATVPRESMWIRTKTAPEISAAGVLSMGFEVSFFEPFKWHSIDLAVGKEGEVSVSPRPHSPQTH